MAKQKPFVPAKFSKFDYENASEAQRMTALNKNQAAMMRGAVNISNRLAGNVQDLGQAAAAGGLFMDTSAASGFQNRGTAQYTNLLKGMVSDPTQAAQRGLLATIRMRNAKKYRQALADKTATGYAGAASGAVPVTTTTTGQSIL